MVDQWAHNTSTETDFLQLFRERTTSANDLAAGQSKRLHHMSSTHIYRGVVRQGLRLTIGQRSENVCAETCRIGASWTPELKWQSHAHCSRYMASFPTTEVLNLARVHEGSRHFQPKWYGHESKLPSPYNGWIMKSTNASRHSQREFHLRPPDSPSPLCRSRLSRIMPSHLKLFNNSVIPSAAFISPDDGVEHRKLGNQFRIYRKTEKNILHFALLYIAVIPFRSTSYYMYIQ